VKRSVELGTFKMAILSWKVNVNTLETTLTPQFGDVSL